MPSLGISPKTDRKGRLTHAPVRKPDGNGFHLALMKIRRTTCNVAGSLDWPGAIPMILTTLFLIVSALVGCTTVPTSYAPVDPIAPAEFSHQAFHNALASHVDNGQVDYPGLQADDRFAAYLSQLDRIDPNALPTEKDRLAFWINAYNAFAIKGILDGFSPATTVGRYRYFIGREYQVGGKTVDLYDLERKILIDRFREPRIHFAIVCASASCPKLQPWAYQGDQLEAQLDLAAREFLNDQTKNRFDRTRKIAYLSKICDWFAEDFAAKAGSLQRYVAQYMSDRVLAQELLVMPYRIEFLEYDWSLNGIPPQEHTNAGPSR